jgi:predicted hotdog family 3-hydroxylacyl-ACP dehydratase
VQLNRAWIEAHIPHQGRMCLLDEVIDWSPQRISCRSGAHRAPDNALRAHGRLGAACGIEFAAQAMAVHGALIAGALTGGTLAGEALAGGTRTDAKPAAGVLASVRGVRLHVARLDDIDSDLICDAHRIAGDEGTILYEFEVRSQTKPLLSGRATVLGAAGLGAAGLGPTRHAAPVRSAP